MPKRTTIVLVLFLTSILVSGTVLSGLAAEVPSGSGQPEYHWQHNPFIPLLTPKEVDVRMNKGGQAAPYENFSLPPNLKLKAVIKSNDQYKAIVGNQLVVPDDQVMGFVVVEVQADRVVLLKDGRVLELTLGSIVDSKGKFTISRTNDPPAVGIPAASGDRYSAVGAEEQNSFIHLVTVVGEQKSSPSE